MRVLHLWDNYAPGSFDHSHELCREVGIESRLICMNFIANEDAKTTGLECVRKLGNDAVAVSFPARAARKLRTLIDEGGYRRLVEREAQRLPPDVLHIHYGTTAAILSSCSALERIPFVISFYGFDISQGVRTPAIRAAYRALMALRPFVHVLCDEAADRALELGAPPGRIAVANLPLPVERYPYLGVDNGDAFRWLIPARFVEKKGHAVALHAFKRHLEEHPASRLTCWGYGDSSWLRCAVEELGLSASVAVIDNTSEGLFDAAYVKRLRDHDAVLAPSVRSARGDDEGGPALTAVLAQVAGKPVIVSDFPGHERSVRDRVEGLVVPQGDVAALAAAMAELSSDRDRARAMGKAGRERAVRAFDMQTYRDSLIGWYGTLAK
jgi:colanic acid/amylovoran biosynthesis glycosyltransferase